MKNYTITVNGVAYDVTVEENGSVSAPAAPAAPAARAAAPAPKAAPAAKKTQAQAQSRSKPAQQERFCALRRRSATLSRQVMR